MPVVQRRGGAPQFILGTAMWGWTIDRDRAFEIADHFYDVGGRWFDTAANYPISKTPDDFGRAETILSAWIESRRPDEAFVIDKFGSISNDGTPECDLGQAHLRKQAARAADLFSVNLAIVAVHWDNRNDAHGIADTHEFFRDARQRGLGIGFSGVARPDLYFTASPDLSTEWFIQIKNNPAEQGAYWHYRDFHGLGRFLAYGINGGGFRSDGKYTQDSSVSRRGQTKVTEDIATQALEAVRNAGIDVDSFNSASLSMAAANPDVAGILISPSNKSHIDTNATCRALWHDVQLDRLWATMTSGQPSR